jgi:hypothetical protein
VSLVETVARIAHDLQNKLAVVCAAIDTRDHGIPLDEMDWQGLRDSAKEAVVLACELSDAAAVARREGMQTLKLDDRGPAVAVLHQKLVERGIPVSADVEVTSQWFGKATRAAVHDFQVKHGLKTDCIVGPKTWAALDAAADFRDDAPRPIPMNLPPLATAILTSAQTEYQRPTIEEPVGSNRGPHVDQYLTGRHGDGVWLLNLLGPGRGAPWCGRFALWCVESGAQRLGVGSPVQGWGDLASASKWLDNAQEHHRLQDEPLPGDVGCILTGGHGHVVLVVDVEAGAIWTLEGNSANRVAARKRQVIDITGFVRLT